jgi:hypothetical protein
MTWDVLQNALTGELMLVEHDSPVPDGWVVACETANPDYLDYMNTLSEG